MSKKILGFISKEPLILFHYLPLVGVVILAYYESTWLNLMSLVQTNPLAGWLALIALYYVNLLVGDSLIHKILGKD